METATAISLNVENRTSSATIPPHDVARLMYYLHCINSLGPRPRDPAMLRAPKKFTDYAKWSRLNFKDVRDLVGWCRLLAIDAAPAKDFVVCDLDREVCGQGPQKFDSIFLEVSADFSVVSVSRSAIVAGSAKGVGKKMVLFYLPRWLKKNYTDPLGNVSIYHCDHCSGIEGPCGCQVEKCDRPGVSQCYIRRPYEHTVDCDGCEDGVYVTGVFYKCSVCHDYGLCRQCYEERKIHDLTHPFEEIKKPGAHPVLQASRQASEASPPLSVDSSAPTLKPDSVKDSVSPKITTTPESPTTSGRRGSASFALAPFTKGDVVTLKGLARADMNGKEATVLNIDVVNQKAQVRIDGTDKTFKVKWINIEPSEELEEELDEELE